MPKMWITSRSTNVFQILDSRRSSYHQVPILPEEQHYTAFEANGQLYPFRSITFDLKNAVSCFQRTINGIAIKYGYIATYAYRCHRGVW